MFCAKCGAKNAADALFCGECGAPLGVPPQQENLSQRTTTKPESSDSIPVREKSFARSAQPYATSVKHKRRKLLICILALVVVAAAVTAGVIVSKSTNAKVADKKTVEVRFRPANGYKATKSEMDLVVSSIKKRLDNIKITDRDVNVNYDQEVITLRFAPSTSVTDANTAMLELGSIPILTFEDSQGKILLEGKDVKNAKAVHGSNDVYTVDLTMTPEGTQKFADATAKNIGKNINMKIDTITVVSAAVQNVINDGSISISGPDYTAVSSKSLADQINASTLSFGLEVNSFKAN